MYVYIYVYIICNIYISMYMYYVSPVHIRIYIYIYIYIFEKNSYAQKVFWNFLHAFMISFFHFYKLLLLNLIVLNTSRLSEKEDNHITITSSAARKYLSLLSVCLNVQDVSKFFILLIAPEYRYLQKCFVSHPPPSLSFILKDEILYT